MKTHGKPILNPDEQEVFDLLTDARKRILDWDLQHNHEELDHGFHTVMQFVTQHMLQREAPDHWARWYKSKN